MEHRVSSCLNFPNKNVCCGKWRGSYQKFGGELAGSGDASVKSSEYGLREKQPQQFTGLSLSALLLFLDGWEELLQRQC